MAYARSCVAAVLCAAAFATAAPAQAACTKLAFSVNDYGKEGPAKDAQALLDQYIARWTKEKGIKSYTTGRKTVTCELFLDVGLFDEYTCKATASVCWGGKPASASASEGGKASDPVKAPATAAKAPAPAAAPAKAPASGAASPAKDK